MQQDSQLSTPSDHMTGNSRKDAELALVGVCCTDKRMNVSEMRAFLKKRGIRRYSTMKKSKLKEEVQKLQQEDERAEYERQLRENVLCHACLTEQRIQRKIDEKIAQ